ncbi:MAG TPA: amidohydrolase family protein, partial [Chitinophagaceae bacterium]|nr:amidohydrolase family protein [Chitinophagaceae bacterium]
MRKISFITGCLLLAAIAGKAQEDVYPVAANKGVFYITNATIHVGNGQVINGGAIKVNGDKIEAIGTNVTPTGDAKVYDAKGKQVYPGLILSVTDLGLKEVANGVRGANDHTELGEWNPSIRSIVAYNTDSKVINTLKANGILLAGVAPQGGVISGSSTVVQLDAWNWEDAAYKMENGIHLNMPSFLPRLGRRGGGGGRGLPGVQPEADPVKAALEKTEEIRNFFREAKAYLQEPAHKETNLKYEAVKGLFDKKQKLFVHGEQIKQMLVAIDFVKEFGFDVVIVGGAESWQIAPLLKQNNVAVILQEEHSLPATEDDDVDQPYKTPAMLKKAGVLFALNDSHDESRYRNLMFNAGTAAAYGLSKEEALEAITLDAAKILGVDDKTGSLEAGKDA